jgi:hypothetical protein
VRNIPGMARSLSGRSLESQDILNTGGDPPSDPREEEERPSDSQALHSEQPPTTPTITFEQAAALGPMLPQLLVNPVQNEHFTPDGLLKAGVSQEALNTALSNLLAVSKKSLNT